MEKFQNQPKKENMPDKKEPTGLSLGFKINQESKKTSISDSISSADETELSLEKLAEEEVKQSKEKDPNSYY